MACEKTITLTGTEQKVAVEGHFCDLRNDGAGVVYISRCPGIEPDADGVVSVPPGQAVKYCCVHGVVYLLGEGKVMLCGNDYSNPVFRGAATSSGEGGVAQSYVDMQDADTLNRAKDYAEGVISNPNILDNGDLAVNQRGKTEYVGSGYTADRWQIDGAGGKVVLGVDTVTISSDGTAMAYVNQPLPMGDELAGQTLTASLVLADGTKLTGSGVCPVSPSSGFSLFITIPINDSIGVRVYKGVDTIIWQFRMTAECSVEFQRKFKLELGAVATPFVPPNPAVELAKCQRYYLGGAIDLVPISMTNDVYYMAATTPSSMRVLPSVEVSSMVVRDRSTNQAVDIFNDATIYVASETVRRSTTVTVGFRKTGHGITTLQYIGTLFGGLSAEL